MTPGSLFKDFVANCSEKLARLFETSEECKSALQNHTKHITNLKKDSEQKVSKRQIDELVV